MIKLVFFILIITLSFQSGWACVLPDHYKDLTDRVVESILNCEFSNAFSITDSAMKSNEADPYPAVLKLAAIGMRDVDFEKTIDSSGFLSTFKLASERIDKFEKENGQSSYTEMLNGFVKAIHSTFYLRKKQYFAAMQNGLDAIKELKSSKELNNSNTDVDFFLGLYDYAKAELRKQLWWVLFWYPGSKSDGIRKLNDCVRSGCITSSAAMLSLSDIYVKEHKPQKSITLIEQLEKRFPKSRFVLWSKAKYFVSVGDYNKASGVYDILEKSYSACPEGVYNYSSVLNHQAHALYYSGNYSRAIGICNQLLSNPALKEYKEIQKDTKKLLEKLNDKNR